MNIAGVILRQNLIMLVYLMIGFWLYKKEILTKSGSAEIGKLLLWPVPGKYTAIRLAVLLVASAPVGSNVAIFAQLYHREYTDAVKDVCLSTIAGILSMPVILAIANAIW